MPLASFELTSAETDAYARYSGGHSFWIPGISRNLDFQGNGRLDVYEHHWHVTGTVRDGDIAFDVDLSYEALSANYLNPKLELIDAAYMSNGGPVDPQSFDFALDVHGTLTGVAGSRYAGSVLAAWDRGPAAMLGFGANGKNIGNGLSNWFGFRVTQAGGAFTDGEISDVGRTFHGDINVDVGAAPVPEPTGALVFAAGLALCARRRPLA